MVFLALDPEEGLRRATTERGSVWLRRHAAVGMTSGIPDEELIHTLASRYRDRERMRLALLETSDWPTIVVDADHDRARVLSVVSDSLGLEHRDCP